MLLAHNEEFVGVRFTRDWGPVPCLDPQADLDLLEALEGDIREQLHNSPEPRSRSFIGCRTHFQRVFRFPGPKALLSASAQDDLEELARTYFERIHPKRESRPGVRQHILSEMESSFESAGVWGSLNKKIKAAKYTRPGDPLKIDCGYRPNGVIRLLPAVSLTTEPDSAKVLAFTYPLLAEGIERIERAKTDFTAVVEDDLDRGVEAIQFAVEALERTSIHVVGFESNARPGSTRARRVAPDQLYFRAVGNRRALGSGMK